MTRLQLDATVMPNGVLSVSLPTRWRSRSVRVVVEENGVKENSSDNVPSEQDDDNWFSNKVPPELRDSIWEIEGEDILAPIDVQWEAMQ